MGSIPGLGRSPGEGHGNPLHYSCLENPMDRETCWATVHGAAVGRDFATEDTCTTGELLLEPSRISQWQSQSLSPEGHSTVGEKEKRANYFIYIYPLSKKLKHNELSVSALHSQGPFCLSAADCPRSGLLVLGAPHGAARSPPAGPGAPSLASCVWQHTHDTVWLVG